MSAVLHAIAYVLLGIGATLSIPGLILYEAGEQIRSWLWRRRVAETDAILAARAAESEVREP